MKKRMLLLTIVLSISLLHAGNTCYWLANTPSSATAPATFTDTSNWAGGIAPVSGNGDSVYITNLVSGATIDVPDALALKTFYVRSASQSIHFTGAKITISSEMRLDKGCTFDNDMDFANNAYLTPGYTTGDGGACTFNGTITLLGNVKIGGKADATFNKPINGSSYKLCAPDGSILNHASGSMYFKAPVNVAGLNYENSWSCPRYHFASTNNHWQSCTLGYASIYLDVANAMPPEAAFSWGTYWSRAEDRNSYYLQGNSQVANCIETPELRDSSYAANKDNIYFISTPSDKPCTVTLQGTRDATATVCLKGALSLIWAPTGDFTQNFTNRAHTTTGTLAVSNGTLQVGDKASFAAVQRINVHGGRFLVTSDVSGSLKKVSMVDVASGGTFEVGENASPFAGSTVLVNLDANGTLKVDGTNILQVTYLTIAGANIAPGTYDNVSKKLANVDLSGGGKLIVLSKRDYNTCTWKGLSGATDVAANWENEIVPEVGDDVVFKATAAGCAITNTLALVAYKGVTFEGSVPFTLTGNPIQAYTLANKATCEVTLEANVALPADSLIYADTASTALTRFAGVISGTSAIQFQGGGSNVLAAANTYTGITYIKNTFLYADNAQAFGAAGNTVTDTTDATGTRRIILRAVEDENAFDYNFTFNKAIQIIAPIVKKTCTVKGSIAIASETLELRAHGEKWSSTNAGANEQILRVKGSVSGKGNVYCAGGSNCKIHFDGPVSAAWVYMPGSDVTWGNVSVFFNATGGNITKFSPGYWWAHTYDKDVFGRACNLNFSRYSGFDCQGVLNLHGYDQTIGWISDGGGNPHKNTRWISSDTPATVTLTLPKDGRGVSTYVYLKGQTSLCVNSDDSTAAITFTNRADRAALCDTTGDLMASNGVLRLGAGAKFAQVKALRVGAGGTLDIQTLEARALAGVRTIDIAPGGKLLMAANATNALDTTQTFDYIAFGTLSTLSIPEGCMITAKEIYVDGKLLKGDTIYTASDFPDILTGGGCLCMKWVSLPATTATWTGGAQADTQMNTAENWGGTLPADMTGSTLLATFATGGKEATVPMGVTYQWKGMALAGDTTRDFKITAGAGGSIVLADGGLTQENNRTNVISAPVGLRANQSWLTGSKAHLMLPSDVQSVALDTIKLTFGGQGDTYLSGTNNCFNGGLVITSGTVYVQGTTNCLGRASDAGIVELVQNNKEQFRLRFACNAIVEREILAKTDNCSGCMAVNDGYEVHFTKPFRTTGDPRFFFGPNSHTYFEAGYFMSGGWNCPSSTGHLHFRNVPCTFNYFYVNSPNFHFNVAGNTFGTIELHVGSIHFYVDNPIKDTPTFFIYGSNAKIDLHGHEVAGGRFRFEGSNFNNMKLLSSDGPGTLTFSQTVSATNLGVTCEGQLSLCKKGSAELYVTKGVNTSTGALEVVAGKLTLAGTTVWPNCTGIAIGEKATFAVETKAQAFNRDGTHVTIDEAGSFVLGEGVVQRVASLTIGSKRQAPGVYGSTASKAKVAHQKAQFAGTGLLKVGTTGTALIIR